MTDPQPFQIRRLLSAGGGDTARGSSDETAAVDAYLRYAPTIPTEFTGYMTATPLDYERVSVSWGDLLAANSTFPSSGLRYVALVRSGFGYPDHPGDGAVLMLVGSLADMPQQFVDGNLTPGRHYYYTLMAQYGNDEQARWTNVYRASVLVPVDYGHRDHLFGLLPPFYQRQDDELWAGTQNSVLRRFFEVVGFDLDLTRTMAEGVQELWNPDSAPMQLLRALGEQNLGLDTVSVLADTKFRGVVSDFRMINDRRGTADGLRRFVEAATKYRASVALGPNALLLVDDAEFVDTTGHWAPAPYAITSELTGDDLPRPTDTVSISLTPSTDNVFPPHGAGMPNWVRGSAKVVAPAGSQMILACGAGQWDAIVSKDADGQPVTALQHMNPVLHGVPIEEGEGYHVSVYLCRPGTGEDLYVTVGAAMFGDERYERLGFSDGFSQQFAGYAQYAYGLDDVATTVGLPVVVDNALVETARQPSFIGTPTSPVLLPDDDHDWHLYEVEVAAPENAKYLVPVVRVSTSIDASLLVNQPPPSTPVYLSAAMVTKSETPSLNDIYTPGTTMVMGRDKLQLESGTIFIGG